MATKIKLRKIAISNGKESLYFEYYPPVRDPETMKMIRTRSLGMYVFQNPKNGIEREWNREILLKAEIMKYKQIESFINEEYDFYDKNKMNHDFLCYFYSIANSKNISWQTSYLHFEKFIGENDCKFKDISIKLCENFRHYLLNSYQIKHPSLKIKANSAAKYFSIFKALLKIAYRDKMISKDISLFLEKIDEEEVKKEILLFEDLIKLANTSCEMPILKSASLFSCMTGLRLGDILQLTWNNIERSSDGVHCIRIKTKKNKTEAILPISEETLELCGNRSEGKVFKGFQRSMAHHPLKKWIEQAGIKKKITFHCFRHTYATLQLALGTDIYTISKMLTHKNISTTQIYLKIVDQKKREAANKISLK